MRLNTSEPASSCPWVAMAILTMAMLTMAILTMPILKMVMLITAACSARSFLEAGGLRASSAATSGASHL